jgi:hypothetical protein
MGDFNWTCPYCHNKTTIIESTNYSGGVHYYHSPGIDGNIGLLSKIIVCPNPECKQYTISAILYKTTKNQYQQDIIDKSAPLFSWELKPESAAIPQPDYIPLQIAQDYYEACLILNKSPKASATLSRRCLQGMIRNFWGISRNRLKDEIDALEEKLEPSVWKAIDSLRKIGNIGAHMEKDIDLIIDVEPYEAKLLLKLIEDLFVDWYVVRHEREERYKNIAQIADDKK